MPAVDTVLIVGGGTTGCALATLLARRGVRVDIAEIKTDWTVLGSGITLQGNALRVLDELGVWPSVRDAGLAFDGVGLRSCSGDLLTEIEDIRTGGPELPATVGVNRPLLAGILSDAARQAGATVRLGITVESLHQDESGVDVTFTDGSRGRYDLVVGADGIRSGMRSLLGIDAAPRSAEMAIWRVHARRPAGLERTDLCYDGPCYIAGYCPTSADTVYAYLVVDPRDRASLSDVDPVREMRTLAAGYHGFWDEIRADITDPERINYTVFESLLVPTPWHRGRTVLIGDAAHACPPTLAQGAAMCLEDATVLAELLLSADRLDEALWNAFMTRRFERARAVVDGSLRLVRWMIEQSPDADVPGLITDIAARVREPA